MAAGLETEQARIYASLPDPKKNNCSSVCFSTTKSYLTGEQRFVSEDLL